MLSELTKQFFNYKCLLLNDTLKQARNNGVGLQTSNDINGYGKLYHK